MFHIPIELHVLTSQLRGPGFKGPNGSFTKPLYLKRLKRLAIPDPDPEPSGDRQRQKIPIIRLSYLEHK